jgi:hypothetical protein
MIYNKYKMEALKGSVNLVSDTIKVALFTSAYTPNVDSDIFYGDLTGEVVGTGYTEGGEEITNKAVTQDDTDNEGVFDGDDVDWATSSITARYAVIYKDSGSPATSPLISYIDFGADKTSLNENFTVSWGAEGILNTN